MPGRRVDARRIKQNRSYSTAELAMCCDVHKNTVLNWMRHGLEPVDNGYPLLFHGATVKAFITQRTVAPHWGWSIFFRRTRASAICGQSVKFAKV